MKVNVIHADLNPCGGAEQLSLATLHTLLEMDMHVDLTVAKEPNIKRIEKAFGEKVRKVFDRINVKPLGQLPIELDSSTGTLACRPGAEESVREYDMLINTHGDILPYYLPAFARKFCITYCHFPVVAEYAASHNSAYLQSLTDLDLIDRSFFEVANSNLFWRSFLEYYLLMLRNSLVVTNSKFSRQAIINTMITSTHRMASEPSIIAPPVCVDELSKAAQSVPSRQDWVLVVSRIHPSKKLENAIVLAHILKQRRIGKKMMIVGNLSKDDSCGYNYYEQLLDMVDNYGLSEYVAIKTNVELGKLWYLMQKSKVYFHPMPEEPFGISVVEAMAAGLVPVVPNVGGPTEFVPQKYQFRSPEEAANIVLSALNVSDKERLFISDSVKGFSLPSYRSHLSRFISEALAAAATPYERNATAGRTTTGRFFS